MKQESFDFKNTMHMSNKDFAMCLATKILKEEEVIQLLKDQGWLHYDSQHWKPLGGIENNSGIVMGQTDDEIGAIAEKLWNASDAMTELECLKAGIDPCSAEAPQSEKEAAERFFDIKNGDLKNLGVQQLRELAENSIVLAATGQRRGEICMTVVDHGEGQEPSDVPNTLMSLLSSNKVKKKFQHGTFNMGGNAVLRFCGKNGIEAIITRRCPDIASGNADANLWTVTVTMKMTPPGFKSPAYFYLTGDNGEMLTFEADELPIIPVDKNGKYESLKYGTFIKMFNYRMHKQSTITINFNFKLMELMPNPTLPIRIRECRLTSDKDDKVSEARTMIGMDARLHSEAAKEAAEAGFPIAGSFRLKSKSKISYEMFLFKQSKDEKGNSYPGAMNYKYYDDSILYVLHGQTQAIKSSATFKKYYPYVAQDMLLILNCDGLTADEINNLFKSSRDSLANDVVSEEIANLIETRLLSKSNEELSQLLHKYSVERKEALNKNAVSHVQNCDQQIANVIKATLSSSQLKQFSRTVKAERSIIAVTRNQQEDFIGKKHPTFLTLVGNLAKQNYVKKAPVNKQMKIWMNTDAENGYNERSSEGGELILYRDGVECTDRIIHQSLQNGNWYVYIEIPEDALVGEQHTYRIELQDDCLAYPEQYINEFSAEYVKPITSRNSNPRPDTSQLDYNKKGNIKVQEPYHGPSVRWVTKKDWNELKMDENTPISYINDPAEGLSCYINCDGLEWKRSIAGITDGEKIASKQKKWATALVSTVYYMLAKYKNDEHVSEKIQSAVVAQASLLFPLEKEFSKG